MPEKLPYLPSYKNVGKLFEKIAAAKVPDAVTYATLSDAFGLKSSSDRALIPLLKTLGFLDASGRPTNSYHLLKNQATRAVAIADATRAAYSPLFSANEKANELPADQLKGLIAQVAGTDDDMTSKIAGTLNALVKVADFKAHAEIPAKKVHAERETAREQEKGAPSEYALRPDFHYNIQVHLPSNASEETYLNIFNALRKAFQ